MQCVSVHHVTVLFSLSLSLCYIVFMLEGPDGSNDHLVTISELDREANVKYVVQLIVEDSGNPMKNDMAVMNLTLSDVNDNEPVWTAGHGTTFDIAEV